MRKFIGLLICVVSFNLLLFSGICTVHSLCRPEFRVALVIFISCDIALALLFRAGWRLLRGCQECSADDIRPISVPPVGRNRVRCRDCGASIDANQKVCPYCGTKVR